MRPLIWNHILPSKLFFNSTWLVPYSITVILIIFIAGILFDFIRQEIFKLLKIQ